MNADRLLILYDRVAEAPDAISRLRRFILDLAVRGKLVEQDPADEPASELLKRIAAEKERLVQEKQIRKPRDLTGDKALQPSFDIPPTWQWCRLDTVGAIIGGGTPPSTDPTNFAEPLEGFPWLTPADLGSHRKLYIKRGSRDLSEKGLRSSSATMMPAETVLFTSRAPIGYVAIAANPLSTNQGFKSIVPYIIDCSRFVALAMKIFAPEIDAKAPSTTFREVSAKIVAGVPFPLPPLAEQHRIVARVEELTALLDRLEAVRTKREATRDRLTNASFARLVGPNLTPDDLFRDARATLRALPALTARPDQIKSLRRIILGLAVRGKLVEQDPADEPASELLKRIAAEKERLVDTAKRGRRIFPPPLDPDELPFPLPKGWTWTQIARLGIVSPRNQASDDFKTSFVPMPMISAEYGVNCQHEPRAWGEIKKGYTHFAEGDVGLAKITPCFENGKSTIFRDLTGGIGSGTTELHVVRPVLTNADFMVVFLKSPHFIETGIAKMTGTAGQKRVPSEYFTSSPFPLPPLAEQHRIVARVDALMSLCDRLEVALTTANSTRTGLLQSLLHDALTAAGGADMETV